jgi:hypothetical protein
MPKTGGNANKDPEENLNVNEQELVNLIEEWEKQTQSAQEVIKQTQKELEGSTHTAEMNPPDKDDSIAIVRQQVIDETRKKLELLSKEINNKAREHLEKSSC